MSVWKRAAQETGGNAPGHGNRVSASVIGFRALQNGDSVEYDVLAIGGTEEEAQANGRKVLEAYGAAPVVVGGGGSRELYNTMWRFDPWPVLPQVLYILDDSLFTPTWAAMPWWNAPTTSNFEWEEGESADAPSVASACLGIDDETRSITIDYNAPDGLLGLCCTYRNNQQKRMDADILLPSLETIADFNPIAIIAHELGHMLGLDHSDDGSALMRNGFWPALSYEYTSLRPDDIAGVTALYPLSGATTTTTTVPPGNCDTSGPCSDNCCNGCKGPPGGQTCKP